MASSGGGNDVDLNNVRRQRRNTSRDTQPNADDHLQRLAQVVLAIANDVAQKSLLASLEPAIPSTPIRGAVSPSNGGPGDQSIIAVPRRDESPLVIVVRGSLSTS